MRSTFIPPQDIAAEKLGLHELLDLSTLGLYNPGSCFASTKSYIKTHRDTVMRVMKTFVEGLRYYKDNREFVLKVTADFAQNRDPEVLRPTYEVVTRFQDRVPYVNMKGIEFMLKTLEAARPARQDFRPQRRGRLQLHSRAGQDRLHRRGVEKHNDELPPYPSPLTLSIMNIGESLTRNAQHFPDKRAIVDAHRTVTYRALHERTDRLANYLLDLRRRQRRSGRSFGGQPGRALRSPLRHCQDRRHVDSL